MDRSVSLHTPSSLYDATLLYYALTNQWHRFAVAVADVQEHNQSNADQHTHLWTAFALLQCKSSPQAAIEVILQHHLNTTGNETMMAATCIMIAAGHNREEEKTRLKTVSRNASQEALELAAKFFAYSHKWKKAQQCLEKLLSKDKNRIQWMALYGHVLAEQAADDRANAQKAHRLFKRAIKQAHPKIEPTALIGRIRLLINEQQWEKALHDTRNGVKLYKRWIPLTEMYIAQLLQQHNFDEAKKVSSSLEDQCSENLTKYWAAAYISKDNHENDFHDLLDQFKGAVKCFEPDCDLWNRRICELESTLQTTYPEKNDTDFLSHSNPEPSNELNRDVAAAPRCDNDENDHVSAHTVSVLGGHLKQSKELTLPSVISRSNSGLYLSREISASSSQHSIYMKNHQEIDESENLLSLSNFVFGNSPIKEHTIPALSSNISSSDNVDIMGTAQSMSTIASNEQNSGSLFSANVLNNQRLLGRSIFESRRASTPLIPVSEFGFKNNDESELSTLTDDSSAAEFDAENIPGQAYNQDGNVSENLLITPSVDARYKSLYAINTEGKTQLFNTNTLASSRRSSFRDSKNGDFFDDSDDHSNIEREIDVDDLPEIVDSGFIPPVKPRRRSRSSRSLDKNTHGVLTGSRRHSTAARNVSSANVQAAATLGSTNASVQHSNNVTKTRKLMIDTEYSSSTSRTAPLDAKTAVTTSSDGQIIATAAIAAADSLSSLLAVPPTSLGVRVASASSKNRVQLMSPKSAAASVSSQITDRLHEVITEREDISDEVDVKEVERQAKFILATDHLRYARYFLKVGYCGEIFRKHGRRGEPHQRTITLEILDNMFCFSWRSGKLYASRNDIQLLDGKQTDVFKRSSALNSPPKNCFSIMTSSRSLDLEALSEKTKKHGSMVFSCC